uniref:BTB/POZ and TAZ domain-containing protein 4-like isoform X2 n=1 Tax=Erigeron canadensis TaxID=72917 RepID=UPI001CB8C1AB|nr:BTB/POZ and TAZ domain-containing protein 4-like isoform X2 [Erigeron canadensis]
MGSFCEENEMMVKKDVPVPPPLPMMTMAPKAVFRRRRCCCVSDPTTQSWDRLFDDAYRADVSVQTSSDDIIYAHSNILGLASPVFRNMFRRQSRNRRGLFIVPIRGVPAEAVRVFIRYLYSSCYEEDQMGQHVLSLLVLSHSYVVPRLKRECEDQLEHKYLNVDNAIDVFQLALLCDAPRLSIICHRLILNNLKAVSLSDGWKAMKESHPILEKELLSTVADESNRQKEKVKKAEERKIYLQLYEAMEALVHICRDGCRTIGPHDKVLNELQDPCSYDACKGLESLIRHFAGCKLRVPGGCVHCKRMWQLLELHSRLCVDSSVCRVPLCKNFKDKTRRQKKKDDIMWRILVRKILRTKSVTGAPYFSLAASS